MRTNSDIRTESGFGFVQNMSKPEMQNINDLVDFEDRLKAHANLNELMKLSASVPSGFDLNSVALD